MKDPVPTPAPEPSRGSGGEASSSQDREIREAVRQAVASVVDKSGDRVRVLRLADVTTLTDYFVLASADSVPQVRTIAEEVEHRLDESGRRPHHSEGRESGHWALLDYGDFVVHVFHADHRDFYGLDRLWGDAPEVTDELLAAARA